MRRVKKVDMEKVEQLVLRKYRQYCEAHDLEPEPEEEGYVNEWAYSRPLYLYQLSQKSGEEIAKELDAVWRMIRAAAKMMLEAWRKANPDEDWYQEHLMRLQYLAQATEEYLSRRESREEWDEYEAQTGIRIRPKGHLDWFDED